MIFYQKQVIPLNRWVQMNDRESKKPIPVKTQKLIPVRNKFHAWAAENCWVSWIMFVITWILLLLVGYNIIGHR